MYTQNHTRLSRVQICFFKWETSGGYYPSWELLNAKNKYTTSKESQDLMIQSVNTLNLEQVKEKLKNTYKDIDLWKNTPNTVNGREMVALYQRFLGLNGSSDLVCDGHFGSKTYETLKTWQTANSVTADGFPGKNTTAKILGTPSLPQGDTKPPAPAPATPEKVPDATVEQFRTTLKGTIDKALSINADAPSINNLLGFEYGGIKYLVTPQTPTTFTIHSTNDWKTYTPYNKTSNTFDNKEVESTLTQSDLTKVLDLIKKTPKPEKKLDVQPSQETEKLTEDRRVNDDKWQLSYIIKKGAEVLKSNKYFVVKGQVEHFDPQTEKMTSKEEWARDKDTGSLTKGTVEIFDPSGKMTIKSDGTFDKTTGYLIQGTYQEFDPQTGKMTSRETGTFDKTTGILVTWIVYDANNTVVSEWEGGNQVTPPAKK